MMAGSQLLHDVGDLVHVTATFTRLAMLIDPTTVAASVRDPAGVTTTFVYGIDSELTRLSAGVYDLSINVNMPGVWNVRVVSTGAAQAAQQTSFTARAVNT